MKLSVSSKLTLLFRELGVPARGELKNSFPTVVSSDYLPVWQEFIKTRAITDLMRAFGKDGLGRYYVCAAFVSYVESLDPKAVASKVNLLNSADFYRPSSSYRKMTDYLNRKRIISSLNLSRYSHKYDMSADHSDWLRALMYPKCSGIAIYKVQGRQPFDKLIHSLVPTLFKSVPYELRREVNGKTRKVLRAEEQIASSLGWFSLLEDDDVSLHMARAQYGTVIFKYQIKSEVVVFHGAKPVNKAEKDLRKRHERAIILP
tara:strand:- start:92858 stop:93637 length:780 start_codon:yes stop_codon:yes gene_type:complete